MSEQTYIVFGYGSLIWKPPPHAIERIPGYIKHYVRRFAQSSSDHRGTPESPGRVVTLIHADEWANFSAQDAFPNEDVVWGVAYRIDPTHAQEVKEYLDYREKEGYSVHYVDVYALDEGVEGVVVPGATVYVAKADNPSFGALYLLSLNSLTELDESPSTQTNFNVLSCNNKVGSELLEELATQIWTSVGPSGANKEYLFQLSQAVQELAPDSRDSHLEALEKRVQELDGTGGDGAN